ncbi:hypothetical protein JCM15519_01540 [Fundidesulfovibrio butyratiphilus]
MSNPQLDFDAIETACGRAFDADRRQQISDAANLFRLLNGPGTAPMDAAFSRELERLAGMAEELAALLRGVDAGLTARRQAARLAFLGTSGLQGLARQRAAADVLDAMAARAGAMLAEQAREARRPGRPRETPRDALIIGLARAWRQSGGRQCSARGPFRRLVCEVLIQRGQPTVGAEDAIRRLRGAKLL